MTTLLERLRASSHPDMAAVRDHLDALDHRSRLAECRALGAREQRRLFRAADGFKPIAVDDIVPPGVAELREVVHHGKNTLPAFTRFAKVFCRADDDERGELWGYNRNSTLLETVVGPGYFVAHPHTRAGEILVNYLRVPPRRPSFAWPEILPNEARLSRLVYAGTQDVLRGVSEHVTIGRASRRGRDMNAWFILCREDPSP